MIEQSQKTAIARIADLEHDTAQLYFALGALTNAFEHLNELAQREFLHSLGNKLGHVGPKYRDTLLTLIESIAPSK